MGFVSGRTTNNGGDILVKPYLSLSFGNGRAEAFPFGMV